MSAGKPAPRFSFVLDNSHKHPLDFNYEVFHMSSTLRPYVLVRAYSVLSKNTSARGNFGPLTLGCTAATPPLLPGLQLAAVLLPLPVGYDVTASLLAQAGALQVQLNSC